MASAAQAADTTTYLRGGGIPVTALSTSSPTNSSVKNYDWLRNNDPGVTIRTGGSGWQETSISRYQDFAMSAGGTTIEGAPTLTIYSAVDDFENQNAGALNAYLLDCDRFTVNCSLLSQTSLAANTWGPEGDWVQHSLTFPAFSHTFDADRTLKLRIIVGAGSSDDMWLAYDATATPSALSLPQGSPPPTTTSTTSPPPVSSTTAPPTTTTTTKATTTTTESPVTTTTTKPPTTSTTAGSTTTTTTAGPGTTSTSTTAGAPSETTTTSEAPVVAVVPRPPSGEANFVAGPSIERARLLVTSSGDVTAVVRSRPTRDSLRPTQQLMVTFRAAAETIRSTLLPALILGALGAVLSLTLVDKRLSQTAAETDNTL